MVRSTSSLRPMSGSIRPSCAMRLRFVVYFSSALPHSLEAESRLHLALLALLEPGCRLVDVVLQLLFQLDRVRPAGAQHFANLGSVENREQQVLDRQVLVTGLARLVERIVETV